MRKIKPHLHRMCLLSYGNSCLAASCPILSDLSSTHVVLSLYLVLLSALIYVVDSSDKDRLVESYNELSKLLQEKELKDASLLIFANKQVCTIVLQIGHLFLPCLAHLRDKC